jgi:hypothetical protein
MKYRIVPIIGETIRYKIQIKKLIGWTDSKDLQCCGYGCVSYLYTFSSTLKAIEHMTLNYGTEATLVKFHIA